MVYLEKRDARSFENRLNSETAMLELEKMLQSPLHMDRSLQ
jgi:hypothetical protein